MSQAALIECNSSDPFVRELGRRAIRVLNDPSLDRAQREALIRRLQARLQGHLQATARKAAKQAQKPRKASTSLPGTIHSQAFANPQSLKARQKELPGRQAAPSEASALTPAVVKPAIPVATAQAQPANACRYRPTTLHLRKAA